MYDTLQKCAKDELYDPMSQDSRHSVLHDIALVANHIHFSVLDLRIIDAVGIRAYD